MLGSWFFIGWVCTLLWMPNLADKYGRKYPVWASWIVISICEVVMLLTKSIVVMSCMNFIQGAVASLRVNVGYVYLVEMMPKSKVTTVTTAYLILDACIYTFSSIYFWKISKHAKYFELIGLIWTTVGSIIIYWVPESPRYLASIGKIDKVKDVFETIAKWNGKVLVWDPSLFSSNQVPAFSPTSTIEPTSSKSI